MRAAVGARAGEDAARRRARRSSSAQRRRRRAARPTGRRGRAASPRPRALRRPPARGDDAEARRAASATASHAALHGSAHSTRTGSRSPPMPCTNGSGNEPTTAGMRCVAAPVVAVPPDAVAVVHARRRRALARLDAVDVDRTSRPAAPPRARRRRPSIDCTKPPPKRVVTFALRCSSRITVSDAADLGRRRRARAAASPKPSVTVSARRVGSPPAPTPQPPAPQRAARTQERRPRAVLARRRNTTRLRPRCERRCRALPARSVDLDVEHVAAACQARRAAGRTTPARSPDREPACRASRRSAWARRSARACRRTSSSGPCRRSASGAGGCRRRPDGSAVAVPASVRGPRLRAKRWPSLANVMRPSDGRLSVVPAEAVVAARRALCGLGLGRPWSSPRARRASSSRTCRRRRRGRRPRGPPSARSRSWTP